MQRRFALSRLLRSSLVLLGALAVWPAARFTLWRKPRMRRVRFEPDEVSPGVHEKDGVILLVDAAGRPKTTAAPELTALSARCTHLGCQVTYDAPSRTFRCPCHKSVYDHLGRRVQGPAPRDLDRLDILPADDGGVIVELELG